MLQGHELQMDEIRVGEASETCVDMHWILSAGLRHFVNQASWTVFCFAPMNKKSLRLDGNTHEHDLRFVADELEHEGYCCDLNTTGGLWTSRVTSYIPLKYVASLITEEGILDAVKMAHQILLDAGISMPRIGVAALNPHAGDGGGFRHRGRRHHRTCY